MSRFQSFLRSFFTEHLLAKFFAVAFAAVTVILIERDIADRTEWETRQVNVFRTEDVGAGNKREIRVVVSHDSGVWVDQLPSNVTFRIFGPKNRKESFWEDPLIEAHVRQTRIPEAGPRDLKPRKIILTSQDLKTKIDGMEIIPVGNFEITVDSIITKDEIPMKLGPIANIPPGRLVDRSQTRIEPLLAQVRGPRHMVLRLGRNNPLQVLTAGEEILQEGGPYPLMVNQETPGAKWINFLANSPSPRLYLSLMQAQESSIDLGKMEIQWAMTEDIRVQQVQSQVTLKKTLNSNSVDVKLVGPNDILEKIRDGIGRQGLLKSIRILADPARQIGQTLNEPRDFKIPLVAVNVPEGLNAILSQSDVHVTISRTNSEKK